MTDIKIHFGIAYDKFSVQLRKQGLKFDRSTISSFQKMSEYIFVLYVNNILNEKQRVAAQQKIFRKIESHIKRKNK